MKKLLFIFAIMISTFSCGLFEPIDECEELDHKESHTTYGVTVLTEQYHSRVNDIDVKLETWKVHCNGSIGHIPGNVITGVTGYKGSDTGTFGAAYTYGYTYKTLKDEVHFKATLSKNGVFIKEGDYIYSYNKLAPRSLDMIFYIDAKYKN